MIVRTQCKDGIVNINNTNLVFVGVYDGMGYPIVCDFSSGNHLTIARYKTKERAIEVVTEVIASIGVRSEIYEMPQED